MAPLHGEPPPATEAELDLADELGFQLVRFMRLVNRAKAQVAKQGPDGIERAAYAILFTLIHEGPQRTSKLAEALHSEISTISRQSSSLVQHGLVERTADPEDGRACLLAPTAEGLRVFEENRKTRNVWLAALLADWPDGDRQTLMRLLDRLNVGIEKQQAQHAEDQAQPKGGTR
ncbi:MarR family winged helix-turn-helix transcriptional regulator [Amycolatopsis magusensis]|uniref:DNA-binding MarR family transcriptional regulator n=1 Tax=Amycolatopsis magusensis TaxID=882444 RepID=A0ABS4PKW1_9PSEU|nr:MarR family transcriptional regulator [Amycolatopsis magusensis]MBP2180061.1 DNA-binding MarR family transcriptional regulator [Amycolatopsis magusensis]MDI5977106.1 MarR family transcriptional regulator [Amycolatopsis magusensis]